MLTVRRFFCGSVACKRKIFAEAPVSIARRYRRKTCRLDDLLLQLVWKVGGESAAAIARLIGLLLSPDVILPQYHGQQINKAAPSPVAADSTAQTPRGFDTPERNDAAAGCTTPRFSQKGLPAPPSG